MARNNRVDWDVAPQCLDWANRQEGCSEVSQFPDTPNFTGFNTPSRIEADIADLQHEGEIPRELEGAFFRVQPDPQFPPRLADDISFNGDGMITRFHFHDGQVDFRQRWAQTDKWKLEREAGKALFGAYRNPLTDDESVKGRIRSTANTNAWIFGGKLWALKEDSPALVIDPATMETEAFETWDGALKSQTFTAHPKVDPATGNMVAIGYAASGLCSDDVSYMEIGPNGELVREKWFKVPYYCMMHDFAITEDYLVLHIVPSVGSWDRLEQGLPHFGFDTTRPVYLGIIPRRDDLKDEDIRWFKRDNCFASHVVNAWQEGTKIHFVIPEAKNNMFPFFPDVHGRRFRSGAGDEQAHTLDGRSRQQRRGIRRDRPADRNRQRVPPHRRTLHRAEGALHLGAGDRPVPPGRTAAGQSYRNADELPVPEGPRDR